MRSCAGATEYDVIVLDVMLPDLSGFRVCATLRERGIQSPVLMLTARDAGPIAEVLNRAAPCRRG